MTSHWKVLNKCKLAHGFKECFSTVNSELFSTFQGAFATCAFAPSSNFVRVDVGLTGPKCYLVRSQNLDGFGERFLRLLVCPVVHTASKSPLDAVITSLKVREERHTIRASFLVLCENAANLLRVVSCYRSEAKDNLRDMPEQIGRILVQLALMVWRVCLHLGVRPRGHSLSCLYAPLD